MIARPQKPLVTRPSGVPLREASQAPQPVRRSRSGTSGKGLLGSIGFHLAAALIAGAIALNVNGPDDVDGSGASEGSTQFEMSISPVNHLESPQPPAINPPAAFPASPRIPIAVFPELASTVALPPSEPMQPISAQQPASPSSSAATGKESPAKPSASSGRSTSKSAGHGQTAKRAKTTNPPKLLQAPPPHYPAKARAGKITGMAAVLIRVLGNGSAASTSLYRSSGNSELDQAAVAAARGWKFSLTPTLGSGETIPVVVHVTFAL